MVAVVVPCRNEEASIATVLNTVLKTSADLIIVVANGCTDQTVAKIASIKSPKVTTIEFTQALGLDIPRAIGAKYAYDQGADFVLFIDGDMVGNLDANLEELITSAQKKGLDLTLTNCYPDKIAYSTLTSKVFCFRHRLNQRLGYYETLGVANPCHGPHLLSRKFLKRIYFTHIAKPPLLLTLSYLNRLQVGIGTEIAHEFLGSSTRSHEHNIKIAKTIIGDCLEALCLFEGLPLSRWFKDIGYQGYNLERRWDLLAQFLASPKT